MRLIIAAVGRLRAGPERSLYEHYCARLGVAGSQVGLGPVATLEIRESKARQAEARRREETAALMSRLPENRVLWALGETGELASSAALADEMAKLRDGAAAALCFAIGGADGHDPALIEHASRTVSLSRLTLPHGLARIVLAEQLYRAATILSGHPYHRA